MPDIESIELKNCDSEDISDVVLKAEKTFGIKINKSDYEPVKTFGQLCDLITDKIHLTHNDTCTSQQAFYKVRDAVALVQHIERESIKLSSELDELFPKKDRRKKIRTLEKALGFPTNILRPKKFISDVLIITLLISFITLFIKWQYGLSGLILSIIGIRLADAFGKEFSLKTIRQLVKKISREHYIQSRREPSTFNRSEVSNKIKELFISELDLAPAALTKDSSFV